MQTCKVLIEPIADKDRTYLIGDEIELNEADAELFIRLGYVEIVEKKPEEKKPLKQVEEKA